MLDYDFVKSHIVLSDCV